MKLILVFLLLFLSVGCGIAPSLDGQSTSTASKTIPSRTAATSDSSLFVPTTETIRLTPLPALSSTEAEAKILELLQDNGGCRFPCWWGLTPGKTSPSVAESLLENLVTASSSITFYDDVGGASWLIKHDDLLLDLIMSFIHDRTLVDAMEGIRVTAEVKRELQGGGFETVWENPLNEQFLQAYRLPQILSDYGQPEEVLIFANKGWRYFELILDYSDQGFAVWYSAPLETSGENFLGCPSKAFIKLYLWAPEFTYTRAEGVTGTGDQAEINSINRDFRPMEEATSMSVDEFYNTFVNLDTVTCLETPKEKWPGP